MTKLKRDVRACAQRLRMSKISTWVLVEGVKHNAPFYEGVLIDGGGLSQVETIQASALTIDGKSGGGKLMH